MKNLPVAIKLIFYCVKADLLWNLIGRHAPIQRLPLYIFSSYIFHIKAAMIDATPYHFAHHLSSRPQQFLTNLLYIPP